MTTEPDVEPQEGYRSASQFNQTWIEQHNARIFMGYAQGMTRAVYIMPEKVDSDIPSELMPPWANPGLIDYHEKHRIRFRGYGAQHECRECAVTWGSDQGDYCWCCGKFRFVWEFENNKQEEALKEVA